MSNCNDFDFDETQEVWTDLERTLTVHDRRTSGTRTQPILFTSKTQNQQNPIAVANGQFLNIEEEKRDTQEDFSKFSRSCSFGILSEKYSSDSFVTQRSSTPVEIFFQGCTTKDECHI